eukprot:SAG11_NODE_94_length_17057_cov_255.471754_11_plen_109_part_00
MQSAPINVKMSTATGSQRKRRRKQQCTSRKECVRRKEGENDRSFRSLSAACKVVYPTAAEARGYTKIFKDTFLNTGRTDEEGYTWWSAKASPRAGSVVAAQAPGPAQA